jgi:DNA-binding response OmpR family regulator
MRILVADCDLAFLHEMKQGLEQAGYEVIVVGDGMGAWGYLAGVAPPDLVVTRLHLGSGMPPGTALGLHAHSRHPRIPVVYIPSSAERAAQHADLEHGAVLVKPFAVTQLIETVDRLLSR